MNCHAFIKKCWYKCRYSNTQIHIHTILKFLGCSLCYSISYCILFSLWLDIFILIIHALIIHKSFNCLKIIISLIEIVNIYSIDVCLIKSKASNWYYGIDFSNNNFSSFDHVLIEISGCSHKSKITIGISHISLNQSIVSPNRIFSNILLSIEIFNRFWFRFNFNCVSTLFIFDGNSSFLYNSICSSVCIKCRNTSTSSS